MDSHIHASETAQILNFPKGGRAALTRAARLAAIENDNRKPPRIMYDSWYHEEAMAAETEGNA